MLSFQGVSTSKTHVVGSSLIVPRSYECMEYAHIGSSMGLFQRLHVFNDIFQPMDHKDGFKLTKLHPSYFLGETYPTLFRHYFLVNIYLR